MNLISFKFKRLELIQIQYGLRDLVPVEITWPLEGKMQF